MTLILMLIYTFAMLCFIVAVLVSWFRSRKQVRNYKKYGVAAGVVLVVFEMLILASAAGGWEKSIPKIIFLDVVGYLKLAAFTIVGMYSCAILGHPSFPLLKRELGVQQVTETDRRFPSYINLKSYFSAVIAIVSSAVVYSTLLFLITSPRTVAAAELGLDRSRASVGNYFTLFNFWCVLEFAFAEEIVFRLGIQNYLAKQFKWLGEKYWAAIILSATLWTLMHAGILEPDWVKFLQVFPIGIALGWLFRKFGTESCILAHSLMNVAMLFLPLA